MVHADCDESESEGNEYRAHGRRHELTIVPRLGSLELAQELDNLFAASFERDTKRRVAEFVRRLYLRARAGPKQKVDRLRTGVACDAHVQSRRSIHILRCNVGAMLQ